MELTTCKIYIKIRFERVDLFRYVSAAHAHKKCAVQQLYNPYQKDRMKKQIVPIIFIILFIVMLPASAEDEYTNFDPDRNVSDEMIEVLSQNIENLFPLFVKRDYFTSPTDPFYSEDSSDSIIEIINDYGIQNIRMFANADGEHEHMAYEIFNSDFLTNFIMTIDVTINDTWPAAQGGCFVGFTNNGIAADDDAVTVALVTDVNHNEIYRKEYSEDIGSHYLLESRRINPVKLSIVHLTGHTYVFMQDSFIGQLHDGESGPFYPIYGTILFENGDSAGCSFDNLVIRKASSKR